MKNLIDDIYGVLTEAFDSDIDIKTVDKEADLTAYGLTSVVAIQLFILLEQKFEIEFKAEDLSINKFNTINKLCELVENYK